MNEPQPGSYGVVDLSGLFPWLIRTFTRSKYCHAFIVLGDGLILEAQPSGSKISDISEYAGLPMLFSEPAPNYQLGADASVQEAEWLGIPYGFMDILWLGLALSTGYRWGWLMSRVRDTRRMICSQLVAGWGQAHGADWLCGQEYAQEVTPGMLAVLTAATAAAS